jgi:hypothetical protein
MEFFRAWRSEFRRSTRLPASRIRGLGLEFLEPRTLLDAKLILTEFSAANDNGIRDSDGDRSDWIEIHNAGDARADLNGWFLTDDPNRLPKWRFPSVSIDPDAYLLVFASEKDRIDPAGELHTNFRLSADGEYLALVKPDGRTVAFDFGPSYPHQIVDYSFGAAQETISTTVLHTGVPARTRIPGDDSLGTSWLEVEFDDSQWIEGTTGVGFGRTAGFSQLIGTNVMLDMLRGRNSTAYIRVPFTVAELGIVSSLILRMKYDDGFVAYLNGHEIARRNAPDVLAFNSQATESHDNTAATVFEQIDITGFLPLVRAGANVLAVQGLNLSRTDSDFLIVPELVMQRPGEVQPDALKFFAFPSPGLPNGPGTTMYLHSITRTPIVPRADEPLNVNASLFSLGSSQASLTLHYRVMYGAEFTTTMFDDGRHNDGSAGDRIYGGTIPAGVATPGQMIRYFVTAQSPTDSESRWPNYLDPLDTEEYFGTIVEDPDVQNSRLPVMHVFMQDPAGAETRAGTRGSIFYAGEFYDNVRIDLHGRGTTSYPKRGRDIDFNRDHRFQVSDDIPRVKDINLITNYGDKSKMRTTLTYEAFAAAGVGSHFAFPVRTELNGSFYAVYDLVEAASDRFLDRIGRDPEGALYEMIDWLNSADNGIKKTRENEDHSDLEGLIQGLSLDGPARTQYLYDHINLPAMAGFLAMLDIVAHADCCAVNYYMYRDSNGTGEWESFPWDVDFTLGAAGLTDELQTTLGPRIGGGNRLTNALYADPRFDQMYLRRLRTLMDEIYGPPGSEGRFERRIDELREVLAPDAPLDDTSFPPWGANTTWNAQVNVLQKNFVPARRQVLYSRTLSRGGPIPEAQPGDAGLIFGRIDVSPPGGSQNEEYIELINPNNYAVDVSGWTLSGAVTMQFKPGTVIPAGETLYLSPDVNAFRARATGPSGGQGLFVQGAYRGRLPSRGGTLEIHDPTGRVAASTQFQGEPTPAERFLRVTEVLYNPSSDESGIGFDNDDFEFIELFNTSTTTSIDLNGVQISQAVDFDFATSSVQQLRPGQYLLIVKDRVAFESRYGHNRPIAGQFIGSLGNGGERIVLSEGGSSILDFVYRDEWHPATDGLGPSLVIVDPLAGTTQWNVQSGWMPSRAVNGSPGTADGRVVGDANGDGRFDASDLVKVFQTGEYEDGVPANSTFEEGDWNGDSDFDSSDLVEAFQAGTYAGSAIPSSARRRGRLPPSSTLLFGPWA